MHLVLLPLVGGHLELLGELVGVEVQVALLGVLLVLPLQHAQLRGGDRVAH